MVGTRSQRIPLKSLTALTLHSSRKTASRRTPPIPQLTCKGKACRSYQPDVVQCVKVGEDGAGGIEWKCEADLPRGVRFGEVEVGCEGWDGPGDPYILRGSCGLTYNLVRSSSALEDDYSSSYSSYTNAFKRGLPSLSDPASFFNSAFNLVFLALTVYLVASFLRKILPSRQTLSRFFGGGGDGNGGGGNPPRGGGGGGGGWWGGWGGGRGGGGGGNGPPTRPPGPPPPYTPKPDPPQPAQQGGWRPGFWTGAAAGWAANAFLGNTGADRRREELYQRQQMGWGQQGGGFWNRGGGLGGFGGGGGFGGLGGGAAEPRQRSGWGIRSWDDDSRDRGVGGSGSGGMRRSTGFGGTNVR